MNKCIYVTYETQSELSRSRCSTCHMKCDIARMSTLTRKTVSTCKPILTPTPTPYRGGQVAGSPNLAPNSILMFLVDLDVHQIAGYHYFVHHLPSRGAPTTPPITIMMKLAHQIVTCKPILTPLPPPWTTTPMTPTRPPHWQACCKQTDFDKQEFCKKIWKLKFHVTRNHRKEIVMTRNATGTGWRFSMGRSLLKICKRNLRWTFVKKSFGTFVQNSFEKFVFGISKNLSRIFWNTCLESVETFLKNILENCCIEIRKPWQPFTLLW